MVVVLASRCCRQGPRGSAELFPITHTLSPSIIFVTQMLPALCQAPQFPLVSGREGGHSLNCDHIAFLPSCPKESFNNHVLQAGYHVAMS